MIDADWEDDMADLEAAEDFFEYFCVPYNPQVVRVHRLHILQRFHDGIATADLPDDPPARRAAYARLLAEAHRAFVESTPAKEKIFRVFQNLPNEPAFVPLHALALRH